MNQINREKMKDNKIHISNTIEAPLEKVWLLYNSPEHIVLWNQASPDWHCPFSENDLKKGGRFKHTMAAKDGTFSFDFSGTYDTVILHEKIAYSLDDGRKAVVEFVAETLNRTLMKIAFEAEKQNPETMQQQGWQAILDSFKSYTENH